MQRQTVHFDFDWEKKNVRKNQSNFIASIDLLCVFEASLYIWDVFVVAV